MPPHRLIQYLILSFLQIRGQHAIMKFQVLEPLGGFMVQNIKRGPELLRYF